MTYGDLAAVEQTYQVHSLVEGHDDTPVSLTDRVDRVYSPLQLITQETTETSHSLDASRRLTGGGQSLFYLIGSVLASTGVFHIMLND